MAYVSGPIMVFSIAEIFLILYCSNDAYYFLMSLLLQSRFCENPFFWTNVIVEESLRGISFKTIKFLWGIKICQLCGEEVGVGWEHVKVVFLDDLVVFLKILLLWVLLKKTLEDVLRRFRFNKITGNQKVT